MDPTREKSGRFSRLVSNLSISIVVIVTAAALFTIRSYSYSDTLTILDVTITADEGLLSISVPLVLLAPKQDSTNAWETYERESTGWKAELAGKCTLRNWMDSLDTTGCEGLMFLDFGYWLGGWLSNSRPGSFVVLFVPIWFAAITFVVCTYLVLSGRVKISLKTIFLATALVAGLVWLLTMRANAG